MITIILIAVLLPPSDVRETSTRASLTVHIDCLESDAGSIQIAVFDSPTTHLKTATVAGQLSAAQRPPTWTTSALPPGDYSFAVYHDENGNGQLDKNRVGWPKEPFGFSNNRRIRLGPPSWKATKLSVIAATETTVCVR